MIATGIFPPDIGGPAEYAKQVAEEFRREGHKVAALRYRLEKRLPTGVRHLLFFARALYAFARADFVLALDQFSVGLPAVFAARLLRKKIIIRTGGDFLWESYVERTDNLVLFREFYLTSLPKLNLKERIIFSLSRFTLRHASAIVFSTEWQRDIFMQPYRLDSAKCFIVENFYGLPDSRGVSFEQGKKIFVAGTRKLKWKNVEALRRAYSRAAEADPTIMLDTDTVPHAEFLEKIRHAYAVILVSLGDISPNMILDAVRCGTPFILTCECGILKRVADCAVLVDPRDENDIAEKILWFADPVHYAEQKRKVLAFSFSHSWADITKEFLGIYTKLCEC